MIFKQPLNTLYAALKSSFTRPQMKNQTAQTTGMDKTINHPGNKLSPAKLQSILEDAESGNIAEQHELFADIEEADSAIASNFDIRKRAILTLDWSIRGPKNASASEKKLTEAVIEYFEGVDYLEDLMMDMMDAVGHGFAAIEITWQQTGTQWQPSAFNHTSPAWFVVNDEQLRLKSRDNQNGVALWSLGWIVHKHKSRSTTLARSGLMRTLAWLYIFKYYSIRDFAEFLELYGLPIRIGKYGVGASKEEKRTLLRAVTEIGHNAAGIMPQGMELELVDAASGTKGDPFLQMINWCEKSAARLILGQTLTSGTDSGGTNTNALGQVHNEVRRDLLVSDAKQLAQTLTKQLILPFLQVNYPNIDPHRIPVFTFDTAEYEDIKLYADSLPKLVEVGVQIPLSHVNKKLGIPTPQDDEPVLSFAQNNNEQTAEQTAAAGLQHGCDCSGCRSGNVAALAANAPSKSPTPQNLLDEQITLAADDADFTAQLDPAIAQVVNVLLASNSYEQASAALTNLYPDLDTAEHERYLTNALTFADILGQHSAG